ncbi:MAG: FtsX-like permease family protein [Bacteroidales bacterium]
MIKLHELKIILRRMMKERLYSIINIGGLAIGMAASLLIILFLLFELSYDNYHQDHQQIYRIGTDMTMAGERSVMAINSLAMGPLLVEQRPEFTSFFRVFPSNYFFRNLIFRYQDKHFFESGVFAVDSTFFDFFDVKVIHGEPRSALTQPYSIVLTQSMAARYFDQGNPVGEVIELEGAGSFKVTAVIEDQPLNSHFQFDGLWSMATMQQLDHLLAANFGPNATWQALHQGHGSRLVWVYVKTAPGFDPDDFMQHRWKGFYDEHIGVYGVVEKSGLIFQSMADIHLRSKLPYELTSFTGSVTMMSPQMIGIFFLIAVFLLVIAAINYTNIAISRFNRRSKEVGVKKVMGARKGQLIRQFFSESVVTTLIALAIALVLAEIAIPFVNQLLNVDLSLNFLQQPWLLGVMIAIAVFVGLIAGGYPALYFSSFSPMRVLRYRFQSGRKTLTLKKILIVFQFTVSVFMIIATLIVGRQLAYINNKNLGYDRENILVIEMQDDYSRQRAEVLRNELLKSPFIERAAISGYYPSILTIFSSLTVENEDGPSRFSSNMAQVTPDYLGFMQMELAQGRFFEWDHPTDFHNAVVINEAAMKYFGWEDAIGKEVSAGYSFPDGTQGMNRRVIGVVRDFHFTSLNKPIEPMVWYPMRNQGSYLNVKIAADHYAEGLAAVQQGWDNFRPNNPLQYHILDQVIAGMYDSQRVLGVFFTAFAVLCIIIAFLGLYGLSAYSVEQRTREIGIRKVLGAGFNHVLFILGREFMWLIIIAVAGAAILAYYLMSQWLGNFAYHAGLTLAPFLIGALAAFGVALLAVVFHARKASRLNPSRALKYE